METNVAVLSDFYARMRIQLGADYESFVESYANPPWQGLRANLLKITPEALRARLPFPLAPVRWCGEGFTFPVSRERSSSIRPAKLIEYSAGLFYIQEPSAMLPAALLNAQPGDRVLDLCAAPGGKSVQIAGGLNGRGTLIANDVSASRSRALVKNLELAGVTNAAVFNEQPQRLAERFPHFFDKILVDAPCSGEGMFRRDPDAAKSWATNKPQACAAVQREILRYAAAMLKPGGRLVYSTCTFSEMENEEMIAEFLSAHTDFEREEIDAVSLGVKSGKLSGTVRIWPHRADGEGHFAAVLRRAPGNKNDARSAKFERASTPPPEVFAPFCREHLTPEVCAELLSENFTVNGVSVYLVPEGMPDVRGLRLARSGWYMGDISKGRFSPSQALAMGLKMNGAKVSAGLEHDEAARYLKGESIDALGIPAMDSKPWVLVGYDGFPLGWARLVNGRLKNHLPPGWVNV